MLGAGGAAFATTLVASEQARAGHDATNVLHLGADNSAPAGSETAVDGNVEGAAFRVTNSNAGTIEDGVHAIEGQSDSGVAGRFFSSAGEALHCDGRASVYGEFEDNLFRVQNDHSAGNGIAGVAYGQYGVEGANLSSDPPGGSAGVVGVSSLSEGEGYGEGPGTGVLGASGTGIGVAGYSAGTGTAVKGESAEGIGVEAQSEQGTALQVSGPAAFATAGSAVSVAGQNSVFVNASVTSDSHVSVTLASGPGQRQVSWVERTAGSGFRVHFTAAPSSKRPATTLTYLVVEPG
jgi:hypothetical protein